VPTLRDIVYQTPGRCPIRETRSQPGALLRLRHCCPIPDGQPGVCKVRYNRRARSTCLGDMWRGAVRSHREKPFFMPTPALWLTVSECWAAICTAVLPELGDLQALRDPDAVSAPLQASPEALAEVLYARGQEFWSAPTTSP